MILCSFVKWWLFIFIYQFYICAHLQTNSVGDGLKMGSVISLNIEAKKL